MCLPWPVQRAMAAAAPNSRSSGWATMASARSHSSLSGSSGAGVLISDMSTSSHHPPPAARRPVPPAGRRLAALGLVLAAVEDQLEDGAALRDRLLLVPCPRPVRL